MDSNTEVEGVGVWGATLGTVHNKVLLWQFCGVVYRRRLVRQGFDTLECMATRRTFAGQTDANEEPASCVSTYFSVAGVVHPWVGQILLKCNDFKR